MWSDCDVLSLDFRIPILWSSLAFKQRSNRTKQNHELTNQRNQHPVPFIQQEFDSLLKIRNGSTFGSCWIGDFPQYPLGSAVLGAGAQRPDSQRQKPPSIQSGHCKLRVGCFSHIFCKHDQGGDSGANRGAGDNQQTAGSDLRADQFLRDADQFLQDDKWTGEVPHQQQIWEQDRVHTTVYTGILSLRGSVFWCPSLAEEKWKPRRMAVEKRRAACDAVMHHLKYLGRKVFDLTSGKMGLLTR